MATISKSKLNTLFRELRACAPITAAQLAALGISADLAVHYVRSGWLERLARGVYCRPEESLSLHACLHTLQQQAPGFHVGGKTALDWQGIRHFVRHQPVIELVGWATFRLPEWFLQRFPARYQRMRLFDERPDAPLWTQPFELKRDQPLIAAPERAFLEMLNGIGRSQPLEEARELAQSTYTFRHEVLRELLTKCNSVKVVRLCTSMGRELALSWGTRLDPSQLPNGSPNRWVTRSPTGLLVLKP